MVKYGVEIVTKESSNVPSCVFGSDSSLYLTRWWVDGGYWGMAAQVFVGRAPRRWCGSRGDETLGAAREAIARSRLEKKEKSGEGGEKSMKIGKAKKMKTGQSVCDGGDGIQPWDASIGYCLGE